MTTTQTPCGRRSEQRRELTPVSGQPPARPAPGSAAVPGSALGPYRGETYYGLPAIKPSHYGWRIAGYFFIGGIAGSTQVLATVADLVSRKRKRNRALVRAGRYLALAGAATGTLFLIDDLHTPQRWYNMLRIFRKTSAMSIGSWTLATFGTLSGLTAAAQFWADRRRSPRLRRLARLLGIPAGGVGALMSVYTGTLLAATSTPLWASAPRLLPALFGASAASTASATLSLTLETIGATEEHHQQLEQFSLVAGAAELALAVATGENWRHQEMDAPLQEEPLASTYRLGAIVLGVVVPLVIHGVQALTGRRSPVASAVASISALVGGFLLRASILHAGNASGRRPGDYFKFTRPAGRPREGPEKGGRER